MGISLDGLSSGLDTTALIGSLMQVEAIPQTQLKNKSAEIQTMISALQGLNTKVAALATQATAAAKPGALDLYAATTGSDKVTATTTAAAKAGSIDFTVDQTGPDPSHRDARASRGRLALHHHDHHQRRHRTTPSPPLTSSWTTSSGPSTPPTPAWWPARSPSAAENSGCSSPRRSPAQPAPSPSRIREPTFTNVKDCAGRRDRRCGRVPALRRP